MASEKSSADFPPEPVEVVHWDDTHVATPAPPKLEDLVKANQNPFVPLEALPSSKDNAAEAEAAMKNLGLKVDILSLFSQYKSHSFVNMSVDDYCSFRGFCHQNSRTRRWVMVC